MADSCNETEPIDTSEQSHQVSNNNSSLRKCQFVAEGVNVNEEYTNYCRIILLIVSIGTDVLLQAFYKCIQNQDVQSYFASKKSDIKAAFKKNIFDTVQYHKLSSTDSIKDGFDISLLIKMFTCFNLAPALNSDWSSLQHIRNDILAHKINATLSQAEFERFWSKLEIIFSRAAGLVSADKVRETEAKFNDLKRKILDVSDREMRIIQAFNQVLKDEIKTWCNDPQYPNRNAVLQEDLMAEYRKTCSKLQVSPLFDEEGYTSNLLEFHVLPKLTICDLSSDHVPRNQDITIYSYHEVFVRNLKRCHQIYVSSPPGCGKSCWAKRMALTWCQAHLPIATDNKWFSQKDIDEMKQFTFFFLIILRDVQDHCCDIDVMIQKQLLLNLANPSKYSNLEHLQNILSNEKCLIVIDGLDEWSHSKKCQCGRTSKQIPFARTRPQCTVLTTTRPWKLDVAALKNEEIDHKLYLNELDEQLLDKLIDNALKQMNALKRQEKNAQEFRKAIEDNRLSALSRIPAVVMQLLTLWFDGEPIGQSQCEIYSNMIEFLFKIYYRKKGLVDAMSVNDTLHVHNNLALQQKLGKLAFYTLFSENQATSLVFDMKSVARQYLKNERDMEISREVGILSQEKDDSKMAQRQSKVWFLHKTFQEFLAALYMSKRPAEQNTVIQDTIKRFCNSVETLLEASQIFLFVSGLCPHVLNALSEYIRNIVSADIMTKKFRSSYALGPGWSQEGQRMRLLQATMMKWLEENQLNGRKDLHIPVCDVFIDGGAGHFGIPWSDMTKSVIVNNPIITLYIWQETRIEILEDIWNSFTVFESLQKLWLAHIPDTFLLRIFPLDQGGSNVNTKAMINLKWLTLQIVISGDILCSVVDSIVQLPNTVNVRMDFCEIHSGKIDWEGYIGKHPQINVECSENHAFEGTIFKFHTKK